MKTLREIGIFVGVPYDSGEFGATLPISLSYVRHLLTGAALNGSAGETHPFSFREAVQILEVLPAIKLDAEIIGNSEGSEPFKPLIRIGQSSGIIISTRIFYESGGRVYGPSKNVGSEGGDIGEETLGPGSWILTVRRSGIGDTGYKRLEKLLRLRCLQHTSSPTAINRPTISATYEISGGNVTFTITGYGFLANQPSNLQEGISIRLVDDYNLQNYTDFITSSDGDGKIDMDIGPIELSRFTYRQDTNNRKVHISASDKRRDPDSVPVNDPLWSNTITKEF